MTCFRADENRSLPVSSLLHGLHRFSTSLFVHPILISVREDHSDVRSERRDSAKQWRSSEGSRSKEGRDRVFPRSGKGDQICEIVGEVVTVIGRGKGGESVGRVLGDEAEVVRSASERTRQEDSKETNLSEKKLPEGTHHSYNFQRRHVGLKKERSTRTSQVSTRTRRFFLSAPVSPLKAQKTRRNTHLPHPRV